jgi:undecaprenyl-diphosphatase
LTTLQIIILAIVQGITEFLPISSSGHLVLVPYLFDWTDQGLAFDVAVHFGSLVAVCAYFRKDIVGLLGGGVQVMSGKLASPESRMALAIALATVPAAIAGLLFASWIEQNLRDPAVIVYTLAGYGVLMALADRFARSDRNFANVGLKDAIIIGCAQALSLVPGTSRSGITITAARMLGFARQDAARFSFLLSAPVIFLAAGYKLFGLLVSGVNVAWLQLGLGALVACGVAYVSINFFMRVVTRIGLVPFAIYRVILAAIILYALY